MIYVGYIPKKGDVLLFGVEASYGMEAVPTRVIGIIDSFTPPTYDRAVSTGHGLGTAAPLYYKEEPQTYTGGSITVKLQRPEILEYVIGASSDSAGPSPYTHTIEADDSVASVTLGWAGIGSDGVAVVREKYLGTVFNKATISSKKGDVLTLELGFECQRVVTDTTTLAYSIMSSETPILFKGSSLSVEGDVATLTEFSWTFTRKISVSTLLNSMLTAHKSADDWDASGSFSYVFTGLTELTKFHGQATGSLDAAAEEYAINFAITNGLLTTALRKLEINGTSAKLSDFQYSMDDHRGGKMNITYLTFQLIATDNTAVYT